MSSLKKFVHLFLTIGRNTSQRVSSGGQSSPYPKDTGPPTYAEIDVER